jgi:hypothetical protein
MYLALDKSGRDTLRADHASDDNRDAEATLPQSRHLFVLQLAGQSGDASLSTPGPDAENG